MFLTTFLTRSHNKSLESHIKHLCSNKYLCHNNKISIRTYNYLLILLVKSLSNTLIVYNILMSEPPPAVCFGEEEESEEDDGEDDVQVFGPGRDLWRYSGRWWSIQAAGVNKATANTDMMKKLCCQRQKKSVFIISITKLMRYFKHHRTSSG